MFAGDRLPEKLSSGNSKHQYSHDVSCAQCKSVLLHLKWKIKSQNAEEDSGFNLRESEVTQFDMTIGGKEEVLGIHEFLSPSFLIFLRGDIHLA